MTASPMSAASSSASASISTRSPFTSTTFMATASNAATNEPLSLPDKPSLAVSPSRNMSGDPEQEYFTDGIVEEIATAISRLLWLFVIAHDLSFVVDGQ